MAQVDSTCLAVQSPEFNSLSTAKTVLPLDSGSGRPRLDCDFLLTSCVTLVKSPPLSDIYFLFCKM